MSFTQRSGFIGFAMALATAMACILHADSATAQKAGEKAAAKTTFGDKVHVPANLGIATNLSPDKEAQTTIFDNLQVALNPPVVGQKSTTGQTATKIKTATIHYPYDSDQRSVKFVVDVRGFRSIGSGAHARLVLCAGESTKVVNIAVKASGDVKLKGKTKEKYKDAKFAEPDGLFQDRVEITVQKHAAKPVCQVTLFLEVDQDADTAGAGGALLVVDSLDLSLAKGKAKAK